MRLNEDVSMYFIPQVFIDIKYLASVSGQVLLAYLSK